MLVDVLFDSNGDTPVIAMQDLPHNGNRLTLTETRCLSLGLNRDMGRELVMRWNHAFEVFGKHSYILTFTSLSTLLVEDKQDPSLVADINCLYRHFLAVGYSATGMYLRAIDLLMEAFYDNNLSKLFQVVWDESVPSSRLFISQQTIQDVATDFCYIFIYGDAVQIFH